MSRRCGLVFVQETKRHIQTDELKIYGTLKTAAAIKITKTLIYHQ